MVDEVGCDWDPEKKLILSAREPRHVPVTVTLAVPDAVGNDVGDTPVMAGGGYPNADANATRLVSSTPKLGTCTRTLNTKPVPEEPWFTAQLNCVLAVDTVHEEENTARCDPDARGW